MQTLKLQFLPKLFLFPKTCEESPCCYHYLSCCFFPFFFFLLPAINLELLNSLLALNRPCGTDFLLNTAAKMWLSLLEDEPEISKRTSHTGKCKILQCVTLEHI